MVVSYKIKPLNNLTPMNAIVSYPTVMWKEYAPTVEEKEQEEINARFAADT
jgi:hypothetical protein